MPENPIGLERRGDICVLTLRRPKKLNALSTALERALGDSLTAKDVLSCRALVIAGEGRAFSAGADVAELRDETAASILAYYRETGTVYERFAGLTQPTVAAIHGWCVGGGLELALAADFRVADETAVFSLPEVAIGIIPSSGGTHRLVRLLGAARAKELVLLRERVDAQEALRLGLVTEVVPEGSALERALELAGHLATLPPLARRAREGVDRCDGGVVARGGPSDRARCVRGAGADARCGRRGRGVSRSGLERGRRLRLTPRIRAAVDDDGRPGDVRTAG